MSTICWPRSASASCLRAPRSAMFGSKAEADGCMLCTSLCCCMTLKLHADWIRCQ